MTSFDLNAINSALNDNASAPSGVDFSGKSLKLDTEKDGKLLYSNCMRVNYMTYLPYFRNQLYILLYNTTYNQDKTKLFINITLFAPFSVFCIKVRI